MGHTYFSAAQFRLFVSDTLGDVYSVDESGAISLEPVYYPAAGIAIDPLLSKTDTPKLVFGNSSVYSQYITGGTAEDVFKPSGNFEFTIVMTKLHIKWDGQENGSPSLNSKLQKK